jgi:hypothetical protein
LYQHLFRKLTAGFHLLGQKHALSTMEAVIVPVRTPQQVFTAVVLSASLSSWMGRHVKVAFPYPEAGGLEGGSPMPLMWGWGQLFSSTSSE